MSSKEKIPFWMIKEWQAKPLDWKINRSKEVITDFYEKVDGKVFVSFSGGKDSTVMLTLVRQVYPDTPAVFSDTGLEFPEVKEFVDTVDNVITVRPHKTFKEMLDQYGFPLISRDVSQSIDRYRNTPNPEMKEYYLHGKYLPDGTHHKIGMIPARWRYLIDAPFKISDRCCRVIKESPIWRYQRKSKRFPYVGLLADESLRRMRSYAETGCNVYNSNNFKQTKSKPLSFWKVDDIWEYIHTYNIPYCKIYDMGYKATGCIFCGYGIHLDKYPNKFRLMKTTHPQLWKYCMKNLGMKEIIRYLGLDSGVDLPGEAPRKVIQDANTDKTN